MSGSNKDVQELEHISEQLQQLDAQRQSLRSEIERLRVARQEITEAINALETLETGSHVQVPIGGGAYVRASVEDIDEVIVRLGSDFAAEQNREAAIESLTTRRELLGERSERIRELIEQIQSDISTLEGNAHQLQSRLQQQLQQQMQGQLRGSEGN